MEKLSETFNADEMKEMLELSKGLLKDVPKVPEDVEGDPMYYYMFVLGYKIGNLMQTDEGKKLVGQAIHSEI